MCIKSGYGKESKGIITSVSLIARISRAAITIPLVRPVAVNVAADAVVVSAGLTVLAPHAVLGLRVDEAWRRERLVSIPWVWWPA